MRRVGPRVTSGEGGGPGVAAAVGDGRDVMGIRAVDRPLAVALGVEGGRDARAEGGVLHDHAALAVLAVVLVVADPDVEGPVPVVAPGVVDETGLGPEAVALRAHQDRRP